MTLAVFARVLCAFGERPPRGLGMLPMEIVRELQDNACDNVIQEISSHICRTKRNVFFTIVDMKFQIYKNSQF